VKRRALGLLLLLLAGCSTLPPASIPLPPGDPRPALQASALRALALQRTALRATARIQVEGQGGAGFSRQLLLAERPGRLRIEVLSLMGQRALVLATDGDRYDLYRAGEVGIETGVIHPQLLQEVAGVALPPGDAVALLLAAPALPEGAPLHAAEDAQGALSLTWPDRVLRLDPEGRLREMRWQLPGGSVSAHYDDHRVLPDGASFPFQMALHFDENGQQLRVDFREVELNPALAPALFRLGERVSSLDGGEGE
jgi:outer membrane biogenesis lipoprotein LolB